MNDCLKKLAMTDDNFSKCKYLDQPELLPHNVRGSPASSIVPVDLTTEKLSTDCAGKASVEASIGTPVYSVPNLKLNNNLNLNNKLNNMPKVVVNSPSSDVYRTPLDVPISISPLPLVPVAQSNVRIVDSSGTEGADGLCNHDSFELVAISARKSIFVSRLSSDTTTEKVSKYIQYDVKEATEDNGRSASERAEKFINPMMAALTIYSTGTESLRSIETAVSEMTAYEDSEILTVLDWRNFIPKPRRATDSTDEEQDLKRPSHASLRVIL
uniref:Uncharacterized protein n=1 Tax=Glossina pallidipes TaxID=7398 RepID=A0A1A9ZDT3_GLOPL